ncbi:hypothetical protein VMCG_09983 [Cytospora schulzeri]|uniref:Uncharacterized protein n=1 Tax=Cytospora schulzeri TaxID=448051 RepID=A0A423VIS8_9PEZI|nr:hypothetical protein VMCG_09983 [Valsa malicola]
MSEVAAMLSEVDTMSEVAAMLSEVDTMSEVAAMLSEVDTVVFKRVQIIEAVVCGKACCVEDNKSLEKRRFKTFKMARCLGGKPVRKSRSDQPEMKEGMTNQALLVQLDEDGSQKARARILPIFLAEGMTSLK